MPHEHVVPQHHASDATTDNSQLHNRRPAMRSSLFSLSLLFLAFSHVAHTALTQCDEQWLKEDWEIIHNTKWQTWSVKNNNSLVFTTVPEGMCHGYCKEDSCHVSLIALLRLVVAIKNTMNSYLLTFTSAGLDDTVFLFDVELNSPLPTVYDILFQHFVDNMPIFSPGTLS